MGYNQEERIPPGVGGKDVALLAPLFDILADSRFRSAVSQLKGYDVSVMGMLILEDE